MIQCVGLHLRSTNTNCLLLMPVFLLISYKHMVTIFNKPDDVLNVCSQSALANFCYERYER